MRWRCFSGLERCRKWDDGLEGGGEVIEGFSRAFCVLCAAICVWSCVFEENLSGHLRHS